MTLTKATLLGFMGASLALAARGDYNSQYMLRKVGRLLPTEEKVVDAQRAATAFRAEPATIEQQFRNSYHSKKFGRYTPAQEELVEAFRDSSAYRAEAVAPNVENSGTYNEKYVYRKFGWK